MTRKLLAVLIALLSSCVVATPQTWIEFRPQGIGYSVELPGQWKLTIEDVRTSAGIFKAPMATVALGDGREFITMYVAYPDELIRNRPLTAILDGVRDGAVASAKGFLRKEQKLVVSNRPARQIVVEAPPHHVAVNRYFMLGSTLVQALVLSTTNPENDPMTKRFLESLKATP